MRITTEMAVRAAHALWLNANTDSEGDLPDYEWGPDDRYEYVPVAFAVLEAALTEDDTEWEYGVQPSDEPESEWLGDRMPSLEVAQKRAANIRGSWRVIRRRKAGPWEPVPTEEGAGRG